MDFGVKSGLHGFNGTLSVTSGVVNFFVLFGNSALEVLFALGNFGLEAENLSFFGFDGGFGFFKGSLEFITFNIDGSLGLYEFVDGFAGFGQLVGKIGNFLLEVLVFSLNSFKGIKGFFISVLGLEEFSRKGASFLLGLFQFGLNFFLLLLSFGQDLVKVALLLVQRGSSLNSSFQFNGQVFDFSSLTGLGLFKRSTFGLSGFNSFFSFLKTGSQLLLGFFEFFSTLDSISFVLSSPLSNLGVSLGQGTLKFSLSFLFFFVLFTEKFIVVT